MTNFCFIVPYRAGNEEVFKEAQSFREAHLREFVRHYSKLFPDTPIYIIEQLPVKDEGGQLQGFMRGRLMNVGFLEAAINYDYAAYHDVDMYMIPKDEIHRYEKSLKSMGRFVPSEFDHAYRPPVNPTHLCTLASQFQYRLPYDKFMGGVTLFTKEQYQTFDGFSNAISSYGNEDDDLYNQVSKFYQIDRRQVYYLCSDHKRAIIPSQFKQGREIVSKGRPEGDTLAKTEYKVISRETMHISRGKCEKITVKLEYF